MKVIFQFRRALPTGIARRGVLKIADTNSDPVAPETPGESDCSLLVFRFGPWAGGSGLGRQIEQGKLSAQRNFRRQLGPQSDRKAVALKGWEIRVLSDVVVIIAGGGIK